MRRIEEKAWDTVARREGGKERESGAGDCLGVVLDLDAGDGRLEVASLLALLLGPPVGDEFGVPRAGLLGEDVGLLELDPLCVSKIKGGGIDRQTEAVSDKEDSTKRRTGNGQLGSEFLVFELLVHALGLKHGRALDDLDRNVVGWPDKVEHADSVELRLVGRRDVDSVDGRLKVLARKDLQSVGHVDSNLREESNKRESKSRVWPARE